MRHVLGLSEWTVSDLDALFRVAGEYAQGRGPLVEGCAALFFPPSSFRTRVCFERGASLMGLQPITLPTETLDEPEALADVAGYLAQWADVIVVRHPRFTVLQELAAADVLPVVNAMTDVNHPCEVLSDLYALSVNSDPVQLRYLFVGVDGNISRAWQEAAGAFGITLVQCCPPNLASPGAVWAGDLREAVRSADVIITDGPGPHADAMAPYRVTADVLREADQGVRLLPCPPFVRGREVSADAIASPAFVGHDFKASLLPVQQAVLATVLGAA